MRRGGKRATARPVDRSDPGADLRPRIVGTARERWGSEDYEVRRTSGARADAGDGRSYTCPACHRPVPAASGHVVAWPVEASLLGAIGGAAGVDERRHWHTACWGARGPR